MARFLVLEDYADAARRLRAGEVIDDGELPLARLQLAGLATLPYIDAMSTTVSAYVAQRNGRPTPPLSAEGDLVALLIRDGFVGGGGGILAGDVTGAIGANTVERLRNRPVLATAPAAGEILTWNGAAWAPAAPPAAPAVTSVFGRIGAVAPVAGDYAASEVDNDSLVAGATVANALNNLAAAIPPPAPVSSVFGRVGAVVAASGDYTVGQVTGAVQVAGQIGGTAASPDVRGVRTTSGGGTLLTMGAVADGELVRRVGTDLVGLAVPSGGGLPPVAYLTPWSAAQHYGLGSNPFTAQNNWGLGALAYITADQFATQMLVGADNGAGSGPSIIVSGNTISARVTDNSGALRTLSWFAPPQINKWFAIMLRYASGGGSTTFQLIVNGAIVGEFFDGAISGPITGGGNLFLGIRNATDQPANAARIAGAGYLTRAPSVAQVAEWQRACLAAGKVADMPSGGSLAAGWRVDAVEPGATWVPFVGAGNLTRTGVALTWAQDSVVVWR